jgi:hypothetical protein
MDEQLTPEWNLYQQECGKLIDASSFKTLLFLHGVITSIIAP